MSRRTPSTRAGIEAALAEEEARLGLLDVERTGAIARAEALRAELTALEAAPPIRAAAIATAAAAPHSAAEKVKLFRELFRGRDDVYSPMHTAASCVGSHCWAAVAAWTYAD
jgi:hypothetical protein